MQGFQEVAGDPRPHQTIHPYETSTIARPSHLRARCPMPSSGGRSWSPSAPHRNGDRPVKVTYDFQIFTEQQYGGISRYFVALATELRRLGVGSRIIAPVHSNRHLRAAPSGVALGTYVPQVRGTGSLIRRLDRVLFNGLARGLAPDVVHETYYSSTRTFTGKAPVVTTVYDMIHERYPHVFATRDDTAARKALAVQRADRIVCISENTRRDLLDVHRIPEDRVVVIHLGCDRLTPGELTAASLVGTRPYFLYVGVRNDVKNFSRLAEAFASSSILRAEYRIVCIGGGHMTAGERANLRALGLSDEDVVHLAANSDASLAALYLGATAFVYPSLYEGFGIPVLEAMSLGCPVVCSDSSSLPEVAGDAAEYFDPRNTEALRAALESVAGSEATRQELTRRGRVRAGSFSWERCARETLDVYRSFL